jgi:hypothetical protein
MIMNAQSAATMIAAWATVSSKPQPRSKPHNDSSSFPFFLKLFEKLFPLTQYKKLVDDQALSTFQLRMGNEEQGGGENKQKH